MDNKAKSGDSKPNKKSIATRSAPITNGIKSEPKKSRKSVLDHVASGIKKVTTRKRGADSQEPESSSSQTNYPSRSKKIQSKNNLEDPLIAVLEVKVISPKKKIALAVNEDLENGELSEENNQESSVAPKKAPSRKRKIPLAKESENVASEAISDDQVSSSSHNTDPSVDQPKGDQTALPVSEKNSTIKRVPSSRKRKTPVITASEETTETLLDVQVNSQQKVSNEPEEDKTTQSILADQENSGASIKGPSSRKKKELTIKVPKNDLIEDPESSSKVNERLTQPTLEVQESSDTLKRVPSSRRKKSPLADKEPETSEPQPTEVIKKSSGPLKRVPSSRSRKTQLIGLESEDNKTNPASNVPESEGETAPSSQEDEEKKSAPVKKGPLSRKRKMPVIKIDSENAETELTSNIQQSSSSSTRGKTMQPSSGDTEESIKSLKGISSPRKRKVTAAKEKSQKAVKLTQLTVDDQEASTSQRKPLSQTAKRPKFPELPIPPISAISGTVFVVGQNDTGQLGLSEDVDCKTRPFELELPYSIVDIAAGAMHSVCLTASGEVITFGCNDEGALGRVTDDDSPEFMPKKVDISERIVQISAADSHTAALSESGQVYLWGNFRGGDGQMGLTRNGLMQNKPIKILPDEKIVMISSGGEHLICLSSTGIVYSCGAGETGQLGRLSSRSAVKGGRMGLANLVEPAQVHVSKSGKPVLFDKVWTGSYATFLREQGTGSIHACGLNNFNQLGFESDDAVYTPRKVDSFENNVWHHIHGGMHHTLTLDSAGKVYSIGRKDYGRLGLGENCSDTNKPTMIPTLEKEKCLKLSTGHVTSFAVTEQGSAYSWGFGTNYQLGHGNDDDCHIPTEIGRKFKESWKALRISGGGQHALILACRKEMPDNKNK